jgi:hypothetical protein
LLLPSGPSDAAFELDEAAITLPHDRPAGVAPPPADRTTVRLPRAARRKRSTQRGTARFGVQARLEDALRAQHARCDQLSAQYDALAQALKERAQQSAAQADGEHDRLRCSLGEVCRLLRQAKHAEAELKQVRSCQRLARQRPRQPDSVVPGLQDVLARRQWDRYFSGEETRDVLEVRQRCAARRSRPGALMTARRAAERRAPRPHGGVLHACSARTHQMWG